MANHVCNLLEVIGDEAQQQKVYDTLQGPNGVFDLQKILPVPDACAAPGHWKMRNWGTSGNTYYSERTDDTYCFDTPWSAPLAAVQELSRRFPDLIFILKWSDECISSNAGQAIYGAGETLESFFAETDEEFRELYETCWGMPASRDEEDW